MRIVSKFQDYYDGVQSYGIDKTLVYVRHVKELLSPIDFWKNRWRSEEADYNIKVIGFCGKIYTLFEVLKNGKIIHLETLEELLLRLKDEYKREMSDWALKGLEEVIEQTKLESIKNIFIEHNTPIFVIDDSWTSIDEMGYSYHSAKLAINPCLKEYKFYRIFDAYQAYQEIGMFLGGVLPRKEPDTIEVNEACKVRQKGFDSWSFRKKTSKSKPFAKIPKGNKCTG